MTWFRNCAGNYLVDVNVCAKVERMQGKTFADTETVRQQDKSARHETSDRGNAAKGQRGKGAKGHRGKGANGQSGKGAKGQRGKGAKGQRAKGA